MFSGKIPNFEFFFQIKLSSVFLAYLRQIKSKSPIQGHFLNLEIKSFHLARRFMGFFPLFLKILAPKHTQKTDKVCLHSLYNSTTNKIKSENQKVMKIETVKQ